MEEHNHQSFKNFQINAISEVNEGNDETISKINSSTITVGFYSKINCNILKSGINPLFDQYYLCECDPERRNAICFECFKMCHTGPGHRELKKILAAKVCMCGYKAHQPMDEKDDQVNYYNKNCLFGKLGLKYIYADVNSPENKICIFCKNLCFKNAKTLKLIKDGSLIMNNSHIDLNKSKTKNKRSSNHKTTDINKNLHINNNVENIKCNCKNNNHDYIRSLFRKLKGLTKKKNFAEKYEFEGLTLVHVFNLLIRDNACFNNLFYSFTFDLNEIIRKIKENNFYSMEDYKFVNNFHLTCDILSSFAEKNNNIYSIANHLNNQASSPLTKFIMNINALDNGNNSNNNNMNALNVNSIKLRPLCYYRNDISNILTVHKYFKIMMLKFDYKSKNIWQLKYSLSNIFYTFTIRKIFLPTINYKIRDMLVLSPLQRLIAVSTNKRKIENSYDKCSEILEMTINLLIKIEKSNEHQNEIFCIYHILYKICQNYAKFGFFTHSQVVHFCSVNKKVLLMINENLSEEKKNRDKIIIIFKVLSPMLKTILYLCYHFNDQMLLSFLNKERNINSVNFFHMKNEISKLAMSNVIYAMTIIQELVPDAMIDDIKNDYEESSQDEIMNRRRVVKKTSIIKFHVNINYFEDANLKRCVRNAALAAHSTISLNLDISDNYQMTMSRLLNSNGEIMLNYINTNWKEKEAELISKFNKINDDLEDAFVESFDTYDEFQNDLIYKFNLNLDNILVMINDIKSHQKDDFDENIITDDKNFNKYNTLENNKNMQNNEKNDIINKKSFNILINFSPLIQTIFKGLHILFYFFTCKKNIKIKIQKASNVNPTDTIKDYFTLETNIFNKVLEICLFYLEDDINNCFVFLTSDILNTVQLLNSIQLYDFLTLVEKCLIQLKDSSEELTSNTYLIYMIKICVIKSRYNLELIHKVLKIISTILKLNFSHENNTIKKLKKLFISYYDILKESQVDPQYVFKEEENSDLGESQNTIQNGQKTVQTEAKKFKKDTTVDSAGSTIEKYSIGNSFLIYSKEYSKKYRYKNIYKRYEILKTKIVYKILWILNTLFESSANFDEKTFLECILTKQEIKEILSKDLSMDIGVRTELLRFYRIVYLDTILFQNDVNFYKSLLINEIKIQKTEAKVENQKLLRFYQNLISNEHIRSIESITENSEVIKFELLNYKGIIESLAKNNNNIKTRNYLELGIIKTLLVYLSKFSGLVFDCSGFDYLRYFELLYHFLFLKKYIIEHPFIFFDRDEEELKDDISENSDKKLNYYKLSNNKIDNKKYRNPFRNKFNSLCKKRKKIIICEFNANELKNVKTEIEKLLKLNFEVLNFSLMKNIFESSFSGFIKKERLNKGMKEAFEKTEEIFDDKSIDKKKNYLNKYGLLSTYFEQDVFDIIIYYANAKTQIEESSFLKMLSEDNIFYNCKWRVLLIQNLLFFMMNPKFEQTYKEICLWELFSLLEYNTRETQKACLELMERNENPVNFDYFLENISFHIMNVLIPELNPGSLNIRHNYYVTLMIIKILKYFCEEHNQKFQRIFFMKEDEGISIEYALPPNQISQDENNIVFFDENDEFRNSLISESEIYVDNDKKENGKKGEEYFSIFESINMRPNPDVECDELLENSRHNEKSKEIKGKASVFEYMLSILGKIILISGWNNPKNTSNLDEYLYDLYFVILEFLIETIQGTKTEYLDTVFKMDNNGKNLFGSFLNDIKRLIHQDIDEELSYQVRKDMVDFLVTFLEESSTPSNGIIEISQVILPINVLDNIINIMDKFYNSIKEEKGQINELNDSLNNFSNNNNYDSVNNTFNEKVIIPQNTNKKLKINEDIPFNMDNYSLYQNKLNISTKKNVSYNELNNQSTLNINNIKLNHINSSIHEDSDDMNKILYHFTPKMKKFFTEKFYEDIDFRDDIRFQLANRMYQFFKFFGIADEYKNPAVAKFFEKMSFFSEKSIIKNYYSSKKHRILGNKHQSNEDNDDNIKENIATITNPVFYDNYLCVAFFESITRMVFVKKPGIEKPICVLFTVNPVVSLLSTASKNEFLKNVDRSDRFSKLLSLMENCDYFFAEISYKQNQVKNNLIAKYIIDFDFYWFEIISFVITCIINLILIITVDNDDRINNNFKYSRLADGFGYFNFLLNFLVIFIWIIIKFPLYYLTESHKYLKKLKSEKEEKNEGDDELNLSLFNKIQLIYYILVKKSMLTGFIWNFIFSCLGVFTKIYFFYIVQILGILNLSRTLKNIILSLVIKFNQLTALFYCILVFNLLFGNISFFKFSRDYLRVIESGQPNTSYYEAAHVENECGTLLYCFATHLSYGMRFDGGIADRMEPASYTYEKEYYIGRFFYEELYFLILVILVLNIIYGVIIDAFSELRNNEEKINRDKEEVCFICGIDKETCQKKGEKLEAHLENVHNLWIYVEYMIGLKLVDIQDTNAINSYVIESLEQKELAWFPYDETAMAGEENQEEDEN